MVYDIEKKTQILCEYKITPNQFYFLWILLKKRYDLLYKYLEESITAQEMQEAIDLKKKTGKLSPTSHSITFNELDDLKKKGYVKIVSKTAGPELDMYEVTEKFYKKLFINTNMAGEELWENYPPFLYINGSRVSARGADKEKLIESYSKKIKNNIELHNQVIEIVKTNKDILNMGIDKFVNTEYWLDLITIPKSSSYGTSEFTN